MKSIDNCARYFSSHFRSSLSTIPLLAYALIDFVCKFPSLNTHIMCKHDKMCVQSNLNCNRYPNKIKASIQFRCTQKKNKKKTNELKKKSQHSHSVC